MTLSKVDLDSSVGYELKRVQHALRLAMDSEVRALGLTTPQYAALSVLERGEELFGAELARRCFVTPQTMSGILSGLESAKLIERHAHPTHGRIVQAHLTQSGAELLAQAHERVTAVEERMVSGLSGEERKGLLSALKRCTVALEAG
ncbi:MarR family winged helix-turn-helix transcriptional regulator [Rubrobacter aplysinae]|uniref:MarR family winged helix-turn-helix transcriptional regulator n=1 Tax=Rubrobacter aplysinae TaxID=909625 RepID=UPI0019105281|nr:MarR family transcriptional regulator [Rubrobacter aplysinae]